jgi:hypothetical protein
MQRIVVSALGLLRLVRGRHAQLLFICTCRSEPSSERWHPVPVYLSQTAPLRLCRRKARCSQPFRARRAVVNSDSSATIRWIPASHGALGVYVLPSAPVHRFFVASYVSPGLHGLGGVVMLLGAVVADAGDPFPIPVQPAPKAGEANSAAAAAATIKRCIW